MIAASTQIETYRVPENRIAYLERDIDEKINKRARKLRCEPVRLIKSDLVRVTEKDKSGNEIVKLFRDVYIVGEAPKLNGWCLVAKITPQDNGELLVLTVPGATCPEEYRFTDAQRCDHCHTRRRRNDVFVLRHEDGRHVQVGRQCITDFLGGMNPEQLLWMATIDFAAILESYSDEGDPGDDHYRGSYAPPVYEMENYLQAVAVCIRRLGWMPRSRAGFGELPTSDLAIALIDPPRRDDNYLRWVQDNDLVINDHDATLAANAMAWARELPTESISDYLYNLGVACRQEIVTRKTAGIVASVISAYQREVEVEREPSQPRPEPKHVGRVGERQVFSDVTVAHIRAFDSDYGVKTLCIFEDADGNKITWWASGEPDWVYDAHESAEPVKIKATVKKHEMYRDRPQTVVNRVSLVN